MNTMTNAMTWDAIAANEGSKIEAIFGRHPILPPVAPARHSQSLPNMSNHSEKRP